MRSRRPIATVLFYVVAGLSLPGRSSTVQAQERDPAIAGTYRSASASASVERDGGAERDDRPAPRRTDAVALQAPAVALQTPDLDEGADALQRRSQGRIRCTVTENSTAATGTMVVRDEHGAQIADGTCGAPTTVPPGRYRIALRLDGALDRPEETREVRVSANDTATVEADFSTAMLEVRIEKDGRRAPGRATLLRGGDEVGTLGSGVPVHVSAGSYTVLVTYRGQSRRVQVTLRRGAQETVPVSF